MLNLVGFKKPATPFALLLPVLFNFALSLQYNIQTFISEENLIDKEIFNSSEVKSQNLTINTQFITFKKNLGLSGILDKVDSHGKEVRGQNIVYTSYVGREADIINEIYSTSGKDLYSYQASSCDMVFDESIQLHKSCKKYMQVHAEAMKALMYIVLDVPILIVTDEDPCSVQFSKILRKTLKQSVGEDGKIYEISVDQNTQLKSAFYKILYTVTTNFAKTIVLLCNEVIMELLFRYAQNVEFLRSSKIWITVGSAPPQIDDVIAPSQFLNLKYESMINENLMPVISLKIARDINTRLVASLENDRIASQLDATSFIGKSSNTLKEASCKTHDRKFRTVVISKRKTKFNWTPSYLWTQENKMIVLSKQENKLWFSRSVTHKANVKATTILEEPFVKLAHDHYDETLQSCHKGFKCKVPKNTQSHKYWKYSCCIGYSMDLLEKLQTDLRLKVDLHVVKDGFYGSLFNGTWNGMIGELIRGEADLLMAPITTTTKRSYFVDFGEIYMEITLVIVLPKKQSQDLPFLNFGFVRSVSGDLLLGLFGAFGIGTILLYCLENRFMVKKLDNYSYRFKECFTYFSGITFQRDLGGKNPTRSSARITAIVIAFAMVCIMTSYSAKLTAEKVTQEEQESFLGMADRKMTHPTNDFKFATVKSSSMEDYFRFSEDPTVRSMHYFMKDFNVMSNDIGIKKLLTGYVHSPSQRLLFANVRPPVIQPLRRRVGELQAFITEDPNAEYYVSKERNCGLRIVKTKGKASWSVVFPKGSPWNHLVSNKIMQYKEQGFIGQLNARWLRSSCSVAKAETPTIEAFKIENFGGLIIILLGTFGVSFLILLLETLLCRYWTQSYWIHDSNVAETEAEKQVNGQSFRRAHNGSMKHNGSLGHNGSMGHNGSTGYNGSTGHNGNICKTVVS